MRVADTPYIYIEPESSIIGLLFPSHIAATASDSTAKRFKE
jgi:hypothetical protein